MAIISSNTLLGHYQKSCSIDIIEETNLDYQKIAGVFTYLHDKHQEAGRKCMINGLLFSYQDLMNDKDTMWYNYGVIFFCENVLSGIPVEKMKPYLINTGYFEA